MIVHEATTITFIIRGLSVRPALAHSIPELVKQQHRLIKSLCTAF